ncbi:MAG: type II secretion system protein GspM [Halothiobacillus sp.]
MNRLHNFSHMFTTFWLQRSPQERRTLSLAAIVLAVLLAYQLIWNPVQQWAAAAQERLDTTQKLAAFTAQAKQTLARTPAPTGAEQAPQISLMVWVEQAARSMGIERQLTQRQPVGNPTEGDQRVQLKFAAVPFDTLLRWLAQANASGFGVVRLEITPQAADRTGLVDATIQLGRSGGS